MSKDISVIVRTVGGHGHLAEALESLSHQTHRDVEVVVVNMSGGRSDGIVESFRGRVPALRHLRLAEPLLRPAALNRGIAVAEGAAIAVLDDDNACTPSHLGELVRALRESGADLVYSGVSRILLTPAGEVVQTHLIDEPFDPNRLLFGNYIYASSVAFLKQAWERIGGYDERFPVYEDWDFYLRLARNGRIARAAGAGAISRSFTGDARRSAHQLEERECRACSVALLWKHRKLRTKQLRLAYDPDMTNYPHVPRGGVHRDCIPSLVWWWWRYGLWRRGPRHA